MKKSLGLLVMALVAVSTYLPVYATDTDKVLFTSDVVTYEGKDSSTAQRKPIAIESVVNLYEVRKSASEYAIGNGYASGYVHVQDDVTGFDVDHYTTVRIVDSNTGRVVAEAEGRGTGVASARTNVISLEASYRPTISWRSA